MKPPAMRIKHIISLLVLGILSACEQIDYLELSPKELKLLQKNNEIWLSARAKSHTGVEYPRARIEWSVADASIVQIDSKGLLKPLKSGRTQITARTGTVSASLPVEVLFSEKLVLEPNPLLLVEGGSPVEIEPTVMDYLGRKLTDRVVIFRSKDKNVVSMGQNAAFPMAEGRTTIEVTVGELKQLLQVVVEKSSL